MSSTLASFIGWVDGTDLMLVALMVCFSLWKTLCQYFVPGITPPDLAGCGDPWNVGVDLFT
jgi:hypothetical protein